MRTKKDTFRCLLCSLILAATTMLLKDLHALWTQQSQSSLLFWGQLTVLTILFFIHFRKHPRVFLKITIGFLACVCVISLSACLAWRQYARSSAFPSLDQGKQQLYAGKRVMVIVPHEDDELNLMGGILEEYVRYGSTVYPVFVTNGDFFGKAETRFQETLAVMDQIGIPAENVIFLGYGDRYSEDGPHLYNAEPGVVIASHIGRDATYGTEAHAAYREGRSYTSDHFLQDIHDVIWEYQPELLFCSDYDSHVDHKALTLAFEKVMGVLLKEHPDYRPLVFKGYTYSTAWEAPADFYATNILSTQNIFSTAKTQTPAVYHWEERIRLPVWDGSLSHSLIYCDSAKKLALYNSQNAFEHAENIINGDKVFWFRDTNSLCLDADIQVQSGDGSLLNDFMLLEHDSISESSSLPVNGTWIPSDGFKTAVITFPESRDIAYIRLYDNPSPKNNVLGCTLTFSDGSRIECGSLPSQGAAMTIPVGKTGITGFSIELTQTEGEQSGLTEIEAFAQQPDPGLRYIKLMDTQEDFMYDYYMNEGDTMTILTYCAGLTDAEIQSLSVQLDNDACSASIENGRIEFYCPEGSSANLTVTLEGADLSDTIRVSHPGVLARRFKSMFRLIDKALYPKYQSYLQNPVSFLRHSVVYRTLTPLG